MHVKQSVSVGECKETADKEERDFDSGLRTCPDIPFYTVKKWYTVRKYWKLDESTRLLCSCLHAHTHTH